MSDMQIPLGPGLDADDNPILKESRGQKFFPLSDTGGRARNLRDMSRGAKERLYAQVTGRFALGVPATSAEAAPVVGALYDRADLHPNDPLSRVQVESVGNGSVVVADRYDGRVEMGVAELLKTYRRASEALPIY